MSQHLEELLPVVATSQEELLLSDEEIARKLQAEEDLRGIHPYFLDQFECLLCLEDKLGSEGLRLHCGHVICITCMQHYAKLAMGKTDLMFCPMCSEPVSTREVKQALGEDMAEKYASIETIKLRQEVGLYHCPTTDCPNSVFIDDDIVRFDCTVCKESYCLKCKVKYHMGMTCEEYNDHLKEQEQEQEQEQEKDTSNSSPVPIAKPAELEKFLKSGLLKQCQCGNYIEKNGGCWYIKCPMCHLGFCWKCNKILGDGSTNCKHTSGHVANPYQWNVLDTNKIKRTQKYIRDNDHLDGPVQKRRCNIM